MLRLQKNSRVLVVVAHPDDELLGLGATVYQLVHQHQCELKVIILGEGITSRADQRDRDLWEKELQTHRANIYEAQKILGYQQLSLYDFPDNRFDSVALLDIVKVIEQEKEAFQPDTIFTHHGGDVNVDHQRTFEAVITACRPMAHESVKSIFTFETPSSTEWRVSADPRHFLPNFFVEVSQEALRAKQQAMECYTYEKRPYPHPRSTEALEVIAKRWGISIGREYAEAFCLVRGLIFQDNV